MIYTSGVMKSEEKETLEQMQDNKLALVCHKLELKPTVGSTLFSHALLKHSHDLVDTAG